MSGACGEDNLVSFIEVVSTQGSTEDFELWDADKFSSGVQLQQKHRDVMYDLHSAVHGIQ